MMSRHRAAGWVGFLAATSMAVAQLAPPIVNTTGQYLEWGDYRIEVNQFGDLGRNWPTPQEFWKGYERLKRVAKANPNPPNTLRTILLVIPRIHATAVKTIDGKEVVLGRKSTEMTAAEIKWNLEQWRDEAALRDLTGCESLCVKTDGIPWTAPDGTEYNPPGQHLFLDLPQAAVASPWIPAPRENSGSLNNDLDFNWKSMAWLRLQDRPEPRDVVLVRFDIAEPLLHLLNTRGRPAHESIVGWLLVNHKLAYVTLVNLNLDRVPQQAVDLLTQQPK